MQCSCKKIKLICLKIFMFKFHPHPFEGCVNIESIWDSLQKILGYLKH